MPSPLVGIWDWTGGDPIVVMQAAQYYCQMPRIDPQPFPPYGEYRAVTLADLPAESGFFDWMPTFPTLVALQYGAVASGEQV